VEMECLQSFLNTAQMLGITGLRFSENESESNEATMKEGSTSFGCNGSFNNADLQQSRNRKRKSSMPKKVNLESIR